MSLGLTVSKEVIKIPTFSLSSLYSHTQYIYNVDEILKIFLRTHQILWFTYPLVTVVEKLQCYQVKMLITTVILKNKSKSV